MIINMNGAKAPETPSPVLQEKTVTPQTLPTVIGADEGYTGLSQVTVNPDTNLKAENIRSGKTIFGVDGSFVGEPVYTTTDLVKYCYENNKDIYGVIWTDGTTVDWDMTYDGSDSVYANYHSAGSLEKRCATWQENNHWTSLNPDPRGSYNSDAGLYPYKVTIRSFELRGIQITAGVKNLSSVINKDTPVTVQSTLIIYASSSQGGDKKGPARGEAGTKEIPINVTGKVKYAVYTGSGSFNMQIVFDTPITLENVELTYYNNSRNSDLVIAYKIFNTLFLSTYVEW